MNILFANVYSVSIFCNWTFWFSLKLVSISKRVCVFLYLVYFIIEWHVIVFYKRRLKSKSIPTTVNVLFIFFHRASNKKKCFSWITFRRIFKGNLFISFVFKQQIMIRLFKQKILSFLEAISSYLNWNCSKMALRL